MMGMGGMGGMGGMPSAPQGFGGNGSFNGSFSIPSQFMPQDESRKLFELVKKKKKSKGSVKLR